MCGDEVFEKFGSYDTKNRVWNADVRRKSEIYKKYI